MINLRSGIYFIIFLMPLYLWRFSILGIPTTVLEIMICILFLMWILRTLKRIKSKRQNQILKYSHTLGYGSIYKIIFVIIGIVKKMFLKILRRILKRNRYSVWDGTEILLVSMTLLFLGVIISTLNSSDLKTSLGIFKGWFIDPFLFFLIFINIIKKEEHIISSLKSWLASGVVVSLISIFYLLNNNLTFDDRLKAFFLSPNHLAMYLAPAFLIGLFLLLRSLSFPRRRESIATVNNILRIIQSAKKISNIQYPIFLIIILIPLYFTYSYGAFLGIFVGIICLFIFGPKPLLQSKSLLQILNIKYLILLIIIFSSFIFISSNKFDQIIDSENRSSFHSRLMIWNVSVEIIKDNILLGIGPGTFQKVYLLYSEKFDEPYLEWAVPQPHNIFLAFYLQTGLLGFIGFVLILFWFFGCGLKYKNNIQYPISNILICLMIYILIHGLVDTTYWKNDLALIFWMVVGMMVFLRRALRVS